MTASTEQACLWLQMLFLVLDDRTLSQTLRYMLVKQIFGEGSELINLP